MQPSWAYSDGAVRAGEDDGVRGAHADARDLPSPAAHLQVLRKHTGATQLSLLFLILIQIKNQIRGNADRIGTITAMAKSRASLRDAIMTEPSKCERRPHTWQ